MGQGVSSLALSLLLAHPLLMVQGIFLASTIFQSIQTLILQRLKGIPVARLVFSSEKMQDFPSSR
jgi:uncharacterized membrane protein